ncbi:MAG: hypothetical protein ABI388_07980 [Bacteroidia bacterium]
MKKLSILFAAIATVSIVACGPSKAEVEAKEKAKQDSLVSVARADSMAAAEKMAAELATAKADSLAMVVKAEEEAKAKEAETKGAHHAASKPKEATSGRPGATKEGAANSGTATRGGATKEK